MTPEKLDELFDYLVHWFGKLVDMIVQCKTWLDGVSAEFDETTTEAV